MESLLVSEEGWIDSRTWSGNLLAIDAANAWQKGQNSTMYYSRSHLPFRGQSCSSQHLHDIV